ncbi:wall-associated receptor kinase 2-like [Abrus precatorius]|uniref:Wall-associated receptor kinase 2-like n=1 Tax=Abrus precatorius TaxID=3816 RepID=A0A8B8JI71_ABRPR|nr:wall-associated receptor kinase 2-like [Abrus precatorius]
MMLMLLTILLMLALVGVGVAVVDTSLPGCIDTCGNVTIPYPFGVGKSKTGENCFLEDGLNLTCQNNSLFQGNTQVLNISLQGQFDMMFFVSELCKDTKNGVANQPYLSTPAFTISSKENKFISVGCDTIGSLNSYRNGVEYSTGCLTKCGRFPYDVVNNGTCSGIGCCQVDIPLGMNNITLQTNSFNSLNITDCSYSFIAKQGFYEFSIDHLEKLPFNVLPIVIDWTVGNERCEAFRNGSLKSACMNNSYCDDVGTTYGYRCICRTGYDGNPYHPNGCQDINECKINNHTCISEDHCRNTDGSFECFCPDGQVGNGKSDGGCRPIQGKSNQTKYAVGASAGFLALLLISWIYIIYQKRNLIKQREKFFRQNGGFILQRRLSTMTTNQDPSQTAQIFTAEELKKATNNYDEGLIIGQGGFGTVFKGILANNNVVAIKKSKVVDQSQVEQFINEVIILSQINHRNVVKLLGCCLDIEVPLLVYEFVNNGNLYDNLQNENKAGNMPWETRLRIAIEVAGALSYLHSDASTTIIHRDVKSANILLDDTYTSKVSDFGASKLVPLDQAELATMVQGTFGYLDPEYMQTSNLTEKSDVYSFGVVLVELLTGQKAHSFQRPEEQQSLAIHFLSSLKDNRLFQIVELNLLSEKTMKEIMEVAIVASKCLKLRGEERPSMKEVEIELKRIRVTEKHPWGNVSMNLEESQYLLHETSSIDEHGNSSKLGNYGYDSLRDHVRVAFDVAR